MKNEQDFWKLVECSNDADCWHWRGSLTASGYGRPMIDGKRQGAHRWALIFSAGEDHPNLHVLHSCDVPSCCNPSHLRWGTQAENVKDRVSRNRNGARFGVDNRASKLTLEQVQTIRADGRSSRKIAPEYGVSQATICAIKRGKIWNNGHQNGPESSFVQSAATIGKTKRINAFR